MKIEITSMQKDIEYIKIAVDEIKSNFNNLPCHRHTREIWLNTAFRNVCLFILTSSAFVAAFLRRTGVV